MKTLCIMIMCLRCIIEFTNAQPVVIENPLASIDFDGNGSADIVYSGDASKTGEIPENWIVGFAMEPRGASRFVRASSTRILFYPGENIDGTHRSMTNYHYNAPRPPTETYDLQLLAYRAIKEDDWKYFAVGESLFNQESELLIGLRLTLAGGIHHGWLRFSRPAVDSHTQFNLVDHAVHPVPGEPIPAGEPAPLPPLQTALAPDTLTFSWDARWGPLALESTTNLVAPILWEEVTQGAGGPVVLPTEDQQRFYRLREP